MASKAELREEITALSVELGAEIPPIHDMKHAELTELRDSLKAGAADDVDDDDDEDSVTPPTPPTPAPPPAAPAASTARPRAERPRSRYVVAAGVTISDGRRDIGPGKPVLAADVGGEQSLREHVERGHVIDTEASGGDPRSGDR